MKQTIEIWWDSEANLGKHIKSEYASEEIYLGPTNRDPVPCDTCERAKLCYAEGVDCTAFRQWTDSGRVAESKIGKTLRSI